MSTRCRLELIIFKLPLIFPLGKVPQVIFCTWKSETDELPLILCKQAAYQRTKTCTYCCRWTKEFGLLLNAVGYQRVKYNMKNYLKSLIWALTLLGCSSHKTQPQEIRLQSCSACRISVLLRQREFPRFQLKQTFYYVECENETNQLWQYLRLRGNCQLERRIRKTL